MAEQPPIRVLIVAQAPMARAGLRALLADAAMQIVAEASSLGDMAEHGDIDVVIVADDALLVDARRAITDEGRLSMLVLAEGGGPVGVLRELPLNGWGVLPPDAASAELQAAVLAVANGLTVLSPPLAAQLITPRSAGALAEPLTEPLTARELEVLALLSQGLSNKLVARELNISEHTVKFHVSSLFTKLNASSRTDAVSRGARQGLITL